MAKQNNNQKKNSTSSSKFVFWTIGIAAAFMLGFILWSNHNKTEDTNKSTAAIDYSQQPYLGKKSAPVSMIEFGDYKCPNCKNFATTVIPLIKQQLVDTGKAKLYFMNDAFIADDSKRSAKFAESVYHELGNETFWKFHELLYQKQPEDPKLEKRDVFTEAFLKDTLKEITTAENVTKVADYFDAEKYNAAYNKDLDYAAKLGVTGTPTIFVNGKMFTGQTMDDLIKMVNNAAKGK